MSAFVRCTVSAWEEDDGEGTALVVARFTDYAGETHEFVDEKRVFFDKMPEGLPAQGRIPCTLVKQIKDGGETIAEINTDQPGDAPSLFAEGTGLSIFLVKASRVVSDT